MQNLVRYKNLKGDEGIPNLAAVCVFPVRYQHMREQKNPRGHGVYPPSPTSQFSKPTVLSTAKAFSGN